MADCNPIVQIYGLIDPLTNQIRYIGKAVCASKRLKSHVSDSRKKNSPVHIWIRDLQSKKLIPRLTLIETVSLSAWPDAERRTIAKYRKTHSLLNVAAGGNQPYCSPEVRKKNGPKACKQRTSTRQGQQIWYLKQQIGIGLKKGWGSEKAKASLRLAAQKAPHLFGLWANI